MKVELSGKIAPESGKIEKAREKLLKQWQQQDQKITQEALRETVDKIHKRIAAHAESRVSLRNKEIHLFDQNRNAAVLSRKVQELAEKLRPIFEEKQAL